MDLGVFVRSKAGFQLWLFLPAAAVVTTAVAGAMYLRHRERDLRWREQFLLAAPQMRAVLNRGLALLDKTYATARSGDEARERLNTLLNNEANASGFTINTLTIQEVAGSRGALRASLRGDARMAGIMKFIDAVERPETLIAVELFSIAAPQPTVNPVYNADITLRYGYNPRQK